MTNKKKSFLSILSSFFGKKEIKHLGEKMLSGELVVTGSNEAEIKLGKHHPKEIVVFFVGEQQIIPCNPHEKDCFSWKIVHNENNKHYYLVISWHVSDLRVIKWIVD